MGADTASYPEKMTREKIRAECLDTLLYTRTRRAQVADVPNIISRKILKGTKITSEYCAHLFNAEYIFDKNKIIL